MKNVLGFKCMTWNVRQVGLKEKEVDQTLNEDNIKIAKITSVAMY